MQPGTPVATPATGSTIEMGSAIQIESQDATAICYTINDLIPQCTASGVSCLNGALTIQGSIGSTISLTRDTNIKAIGCTPSQNTLSRSHHMKKKLLAN